MSNLPDRAPKGIWGTVLIPVGATSEIDWDALDEELAILCGSGLGRIYSGGTAGEGPVLTEAEHDRLVERMIVVAGAAGVPFQIGIAHSNPRMVRQRLGRVASSGAAGAQIVLPDWWPPSIEECRIFLSGM